VPAVSGPQYRLMAGLAHGWQPSGMKRPPSAGVAKDFVDATPPGDRSRWSGGRGGGGAGTGMGGSNGGFKWGPSNKGGF
jgi:hypothetical protein